jgi:Lrp/AsnC family transcriptional regulator
MQVRMDSVDQQILALLQQDATLATAEIAEKVGLSQSPCWRRINSLFERGLIRRRVAVLDRNKVGLEVMVLVQIKLSSHGRKSLDEFQERVAKIPAVTQCFLVMGDIDFVLTVVTRDVGQYESLVRHQLSQLPGVHEINSRIVLAEIKNTTELPLEILQEP